MFVHRFKLRPPQLLPAWIGRPSVESRLGESTSVFSIVAGPGYGKTVLAARLYDTWQGARLWYSLDATDTDLAVFAAYMQALLAPLRPNEPALEEPWRLNSPREVGSLFAELIAEAAPSVLMVFDDVHVLEESRSLAALGELVERGARAGATVVVSGRSMPLSLHSIAASGRLATAGPAELSFDAAESRAYLERALAGERDSSALDGLARRAEGWPAGLALVASAATQFGEGAAPGLSGARNEEAQRQLFDYLAAEVLEGLTEREQRFLLETSILDDLEVHLCDEVTDEPDAAALLPSLVRRGLFITRRSEDAYTAHQLFRAFLYDTLLRARPFTDVAILHQRAAAACARGGDHVAAIAHWLDAADIERAVRAFEKMAFAMLASGLLERADGFLQRIGSERIASSPTLLTAQGRLEQIRGDWDRALTSLERATRLARERGLPDVAAEAVRAASGILAARGEFSRLLGTIEETLKLELSEASRTALQMTLGAVLLENDRLDEALDVFRKITPSVVRRGDLALQGILLHNTGVAHIRRGDPYAAVSMYERALKIKRSAGQRVSALVTLGNLIFAMLVVGDLDEAGRLVPQYLEDASDIGNAAMLAHARGNEGFLSLLREDFSGALVAFREAQRNCDPADVLVLPEVLHGLAQALLRLGYFAEADETCTRGVALMRAAPRRQQLGPLLLTQAECALVRGEGPRALRLAGEALAGVAGGADAVLAAGVNIEAAALLVRIAPRLEADAASEADGRATAAAAAGLALLHQRDYRFLLRTKGAAFSALREHLARWGVGQGLRSEAAKPAAGLRIEMLGGLRVFVAGEALPAAAWKRRKARDIFAYLVSLRGRSVARSRLIDLFWPELEADAAHDNLRVTISAIRKAVGDVVKFEMNGYRFVPPDHTSVDTEQMEEHLEAARQAQLRGLTAAVRAGFMAAAELYRGEFLDGFEEGGWQWRERERLRAGVLEALRWLVADAEGEEAFRRLTLDRLLEIAPFDLDAVGRRLEGMVAEQRFDDARRDYEEWKERYRTAVGADPPEIWRVNWESSMRERSVRELLRSEA